MTDHGRFSEAIRAVYDAAVAEDRWQDALDASVDLLGAKSSALMVADVEADLPYTVSALSRDFRQLPAGVLPRYVERYSHLEAGAYAYVKARPHQLVFDDRAVWPDIDDPRDRADYGYLHERLGVFRRLIARLNDNQRWFDCITFQFDERHRDVPRESVERTRDLVPHLAKAVELGRVNHRLRRLYGAVLGALDRVRIGLCVLLSSGEVIVANTEATRILDAADGLSRSRLNRLISSEGTQSDEIASAASRLSATAAGDNRECVHTLHVERDSGGPPIILEITALRDSYAEIDAGLHAALVTMIDTGRCQDIRLDVFARVYALTEAEAEVCRLALDGLRDEEMAEVRRVKPSTIASQMKSIRAKCGTSSRVELVRLALQTSPPIF